MRHGFKDPDAIKTQKPLDSNQARSRQVFGAQQPNYDERSGFFVSQGTDYGTGMRQPVGGEGLKDVIPMTSREINLGYTTR